MVRPITKWRLLYNNVIVLSFSLPKRKKKKNDGLTFLILNDKFVFLLTPMLIAVQYLIQIFTLMSKKHLFSIQNNQLNLRSLLCN